MTDNKTTKQCVISGKTELFSVSFSLTQSSHLKWNVPFKKRQKARSFQLKGTIYKIKSQLNIGGNQWELSVCCKFGSHSGAQTTGIQAGFSLKGQPVSAWWLQRLQDLQGLQGQELILQRRSGWVNDNNWHILLINVLLWDEFNHGNNVSEKFKFPHL